jgi:hypothetical protein
MPCMFVRGNPTAAPLRGRPPWHVHGGGARGVPSAARSAPPGVRAHASPRAPQQHAPRERRATRSGGACPTRMARGPVLGCAPDMCVLYTTRARVTRGAVGEPSELPTCVAWRTSPPIYSVQCPHCLHTHPRRSARTLVVGTEGEGRGTWRWRSPSLRSRPLFHPHMKSLPPFLMRGPPHSLVRQASH